MTETRTYFVKVTTNGVECITEKTITVNPNPTAEVIPDYEFCDNTEDNEELEIPTLEIGEETEKIQKERIDNIRNKRDNNLVVLIFHCITLLSTL